MQVYHVLASTDCFVYGQAAIVLRGGTTIQKIGQGVNKSDYGNWLDERILRSF